MLHCETILKMVKSDHYSSICRLCRYFFCFWFCTNKMKLARYNLSLFLSLCVCVCVCVCGDRARDTPSILFRLISKFALLHLSLVYPDGASQINDIFHYLHSSFSLICLECKCVFFQEGQAGRKCRKFRFRQKGIFWTHIVSTSAARSLNQISIIHKHC